MSDAADTFPNGLGSIKLSQSPRILRRGHRTLEDAGNAIQCPTDIFCTAQLANLFGESTGAQKTRRALGRRPSLFSGGQFFLFFFVFFRPGGRFRSVLFFFLFCLLGPGLRCWGLGRRRKCSVEGIPFPPPNKSFGEQRCDSPSNRPRPPKFRLKANFEVEGACC